MADFRALCAELVETLSRYQERLEETYDPDSAEAKELDAGFRVLERARAALAEPEPVGLSPREVEAQDAFTQIRDEILSLSDGVEVNEVLGIIDNYTPEWVWRDRPVAEPEPLPDTDVMRRLLSAPMDSRGYVDLRPGRAALAETEPVGPTDKELHQLWQELYSFHDGPTSGDVAEIARAVLALWGTPNLAQVRSSLGDEPVPALCDTQTLLDAFYILVAQTNRLLLKVEKDLVKIADGDDDWRAAEALRNLRPIMKRFQALATAEKERAPIPKPQPHGGRMIKGWQ